MILRRGVPLLRCAAPPPPCRLSSYPCPTVSLAAPALDWEYITDPANTARIQRNIDARKSQADIKKVQKLYKDFFLNGCMKPAEKRAELEKELLTSALALPNSSPDWVLELGGENKTIHEEPFTSPPHKLKKFEDISRILSGARLANLGLLTGERSYFLSGALAELEYALVQWCTAELVGRGFSLVSVPDILHPDVISACGMEVQGERSQVCGFTGYIYRNAPSGVQAGCGVRPRRPVWHCGDGDRRPAGVHGGDGAALPGRRVQVLQGRGWGRRQAGGRALQGPPVHQGRGLPPS